MAYNIILKQLREDNDKLQKDIAAYLGISQQYYSEYEIGNRKLPIEHLAKLALFTVFRLTIFSACLKGSPTLTDNLFNVKTKAEAVGVFRPLFI